MLYTMHMTWYYSHQQLVERMNCFENVNSFLNIRTISWWPEACALVFYMLVRLSIKPGTSVMMNDTVIKLERSCRYLGHTITNDLDDDVGIIRQLLSYCGKADIQSLFSKCKKKCFPLIAVICILATCGAGTLCGNTCKYMLHMIMFLGD